MTTARELRFAVATENYDAAVHLYRDVFALEVLEEFDEQAGRGILLKVPKATLELVDLEHKAMVDEIEVGRATDGRFRIAVKVDDLSSAAGAVAEAGPEPMAAPVETPWGDRNQRFRAGDGMEITLFQSP